MAVMAGAEPFTHDGGSIGALLCHGFTGSPYSMRPWAEHLAAEGLSVSLPRLWKLTQDNLGELTQPVLAYRSTEDHVVGPRSMEVLNAALRPGLLTVRSCGGSYHVATLDNDAPAIFAGSLDFVRAHSRAGNR